MADEPKVVMATGAAGTGNFTGKAIQNAMTRAAQEAAEKGITDPDEIRRMMLDARERVRKGGA